MVKAKRLLGAAGGQVELLGVGANPDATADPLGARVLRSARDDARLALPQRAARGAQARLARVRDRSADRPGAGRPHSRGVRDRHSRRALAPVHDADVLRERRAARGALRAGGIAAAAEPPVGAFGGLLRPGPVDRTDTRRQPPARGRRQRAAWPERRAAPAAVLRHVGLRGHRSRTGTRGARRVRGVCGQGRAPGAHRRRRGERRAVARRAAAVPRGTAPPALIPSRDRRERPPRGRLQDSGRALPRAPLAVRPVPLVPRRERRGLALERGARAPDRASLWHALPHSTPAGATVRTAACRLASRARKRCTARPGSCWAPSGPLRLACRTCAAIRSSSTCGRRGAGPAARSSLCSRAHR